MQSSPVHVAWQDGAASLTIFFSSTLAFSVVVVGAAAVVVAASVVVVTASVVIIDNKTVRVWY